MGVCIAWCRCRGIPSFRFLFQFSKETLSVCVVFVFLYNNRGERESMRWGVICKCTHFSWKKHLKIWSLIWANSLHGSKSKSKHNHLQMHLAHLVILVILMGVSAPRKEGCEESNKVSTARTWSFFRLWFGCRPGHSTRKSEKKMERARWQPIGRHWKRMPQFWFGPAACRLQSPDKSHGERLFYSRQELIKEGEREIEKSWLCSESKKLWLCAYQHIWVCRSAPAFWKCFFGI